MYKKITRSDNYRERCGNTRLLETQLEPRNYPVLKMQIIIYNQAYNAIIDVLNTLEITMEAQRELVPLDQISALLLNKLEENDVIAAIEKAQKLTLSARGLIHINFCLSASGGEYKYSFALYKSLLSHCVIDPTLVTEHELGVAQEIIETLISCISPTQDHLALMLIQTIETLFGEMLSSKLDVEKLFNSAVTRQKDKTFEYLLPRMKFEQRADKDVLVTLRDVSVGQLKVLLKKDAKRNLSVSMLLYLFQKISKTPNTDTDDLMMKIFDHYGYPKFGDEKECWSNMGRENFMKSLLDSQHFFPKVAAVILPADKADCRSTFAYIVLKGHANYLAAHQKELREFYCTNYKMSANEFDKLFKLDQPAVTSAPAPVTSKVEAPRAGLFK